ncbi:hypothetical protein BZF66_05585 [Salmonella enterica]|uniref:hypothetical protein n=1 Tax=Salmonella enterica TaxID=28901 RepID=UPI000FDF9B6B|nr:hypothetical protein CPT_Munch_492 [Salmonella phage Munch]EAZ2022763.1 hypothetical protein [Salmonella enterica]ECV9083897.1 hypothetical protein [Salmonella enterica subsp. enterica serovar Infantis]MCP0435506.1 hypothetical protein [Salmonella enterica subsp. enterica serovar Mbandaka]ELL7856342.1 hypothetical protein [Salmonella enterica]
MKGTTIIISILFVLFGIGVKTVVQKAMVQDLKCEVRVIYDDYRINVNTGTFQSDELDKIVEYGGAMLGEHINDLKKVNKGLYAGSGKKHDDVLASVVTCKKVE